MRLKIKILKKHDDGTIYYPCTVIFLNKYSQSVYTCKTMIKFLVIAHVLKRKENKWRVSKLVSISFIILFPKFLKEQK